MMGEGKIGAETEKNKRDEDNFGPDEKYKKSRLSSQITLARVKNYEDLNAPTEKERDEKFIAKTRELWKELAVHGLHMEIIRQSDLDGKTCLGLMKEAGIDTKGVSYTGKGVDDKQKGKIVMDAGEREGIVLGDKEGRIEGEEGFQKEELGMTAYFDHHGDDSKRGTCAAKIVYEALAELGLLKKEKYYDDLIEFVRQTDSAEYPEGWNEEMYKKSKRTFRGLEKIATFENTLKFFKKEGDIAAADKELSDEEIKEYELDKIIFRRENGKTIKEKYTEARSRSVDNSLADLKKLQGEGFVIDSDRYGKIIVSIDKKIDNGIEAVRAAGGDTYISYNSESKGFHLSTKREVKDFDKLKSLQDDFKLIRETMIIKKDNNKDLAKLDEILSILTDGKAKLGKGLEEYLKKEKEGKEAEKPEEKKEEKLKEETEFEKKRKEDEARLHTMRNMMDRIRFAEIDLKEAEEEMKVSKAYNKMNAWGVPPFEPLSSDDTIDFRKRLLRQDYEEIKQNLDTLKMIYGDPERAKLFIEEEDRHSEKLKGSKEKAIEVAEDAKGTLEFYREGYVGIRKKRRKVWTRIKCLFSKKYRNDMKEMESNSLRMYTASIDSYKKARFDEIKSRGLKGEELRKAVLEARRKINLVESLVYYSGNDDFIKEMEKKEAERIKREAEKAKKEAEKEKTEKEKLKKKSEEDAKVFAEKDKKDKEKKEQALAA